ncbi:VHS domain-containing protein [Pestalotiopsis sp. NC0098]|nr:VHS domain-containing protein [Pestalotiopsis sp. NC0098]
MFRAAAPGPFDEAIAKATNENLTSEDWGAIIEVCDKVTTDPNGPSQAVQATIKRLAHRNANVQLYTLELANALSQNCGKPMHRELASRAFTDALLKLANDRNTHQQVKAKILERMKEWSDMFSKDADLGIMYDAYFRLKQTNPTLQPPSAPQKNRLTDVDRQKEEDELQMALQLSLQDEERKKKATESSATAAAGPSSGAGGSAGPAQAQPEPIPSHPTGTTAATVSRVRALYDFVPSEPGELEFKKGDVIAVLESVFKDWWRGSLKGNTGIFPLNYVEKLTDPTPDELHREAQMEAEVFAEIKNVEKLLTLLSTSNTAPREEDNEEISKLYHQTLAIRPKLIKLIEKYSQKKDDFTQLNEKFIKARRDYESLLESSMSHPPGPSYHQYPHRPVVPGQGGYPGGPSGYAPQGPPQHFQQDPQRFYTPGPQGPPPQQEQPPFQATSPPPNFQRQTPGPAPFYLQGAEVPAHAGQPPHQQQQYNQAGGPPPGHQQQYAQGGPAPGQAPYSQPGPAPGQQQYPPRDQPSRLASSVAQGKQPAPIQTSSPPPAQQAYQAYPHPSQQQAGEQHQSTHGNPQELATSAYDSPVASHPGPDPYSASVYSTEDPYASSPTAPSAPPPSGIPQGVPTALAIAGGSGPSAPSAPSAPSQPQYTAYNPLQPPQPSYNAPSAPTNAPPPVPTASAPAIPSPDGIANDAFSPPPLHPSGPAYDARNNLPSQYAHSQPSQPQYKAYIPNAPPAGGSNEPSAPQDFYRQNAAY